MIQSHEFVKTGEKQMKSFNAQTSENMLHDYKDENIQTDENFFKPAQPEKKEENIQTQTQKEKEIVKEDKEIQKDFLKSKSMMSNKPNLFEKLTDRKRSRRSSNKSTPNSSRLIKDFDIDHIRNESMSNISVHKEKDSSKNVKEVVGFYENFFFEQLHKWKEIEGFVDKLKKRGNEHEVDNSMRETINKIGSQVSANIQLVQGISRNPSKSNLNKKQPIKPALALDIKEINKHFNENNLEFRKLNQISNNHSRSIEGPILTPSHSQSHRKSIEKWIFPDAEKAAKSNIDLARAILIDPEASKNSNMSSQKFNSIHDVK